MHPAYSIIFFTVSSGMGYGLIIATSLMLMSENFKAGSSTAWLALTLGMILVIAGLLSSTFHLGHPERAWRAFSQWRTSWLSREGVSAVLSLFATSWLIVLAFIDRTQAAVLMCSVVIVMSFVTVFCTAMIYASLKPIPRWHHPLVPILYLLFSLSTGAVLLLAIMVLFGQAAPRLLTISCLLVMMAWILKWFYWRSSDARGLNSTTQTATGLGRLMNNSSESTKLASVSMMDVPHTSKNYVQKEMGFVIARRHRDKLRRMALIGGLLLPLVLLGVTALASLPMQTVLIVLALLLTTLAQIVERWLFFAEAQHVVTLFYGQ